MFDIKNKPFIVEGLENIIVCAFLHGFHSLFNSAVGCHHDYRKIRIFFLDALKKINAVHGWHFHIRQHQIDVGFGKGGHRLCAAVRSKRLKTLIFQHGCKDKRIIYLIVNNEDRFHYLAS